MSRCHHGHIICQSWEECPECCDEHDARQAADAAQQTAEESVKQTELLRQIAADGKRARELEQENQRLRDELAARKRSQ